MTTRSIQTGSRYRSLSCVTLLAVVIVSGCEAKIKVKTANRPAPAEVTPVDEPKPVEGIVKNVREIPVAGNKLYAQTRSQLRLGLSTEMEDEDPNSLVIVNNTSQVSLKPDAVSAAGCSKTPCLSFAAKTALRTRLLANYGASKVEVFSEHTNEYLKGTYIVTLRDFQVMGPLSLMTVDAAGTVKGSMLRPMTSTVMTIAPTTPLTDPADSILIGPWTEQVEYP